MNKLYWFLIKFVAYIGFVDFLQWQIADMNTSVHKQKMEHLAVRTTQILTIPVKCVGTLSKVKAKRGCKLYSLTLTYTILREIPRIHMSEYKFTFLFHIPLVNL